MKHPMIFFVALIISSASLATANQVALDSKIYVERAIVGADGKIKVVRDQPKVVTPGDVLVFELTYKNLGSAPAENFTVTNPVPKSVRFVSSDANGAEFSVDGGARWGSLGQLQVKEADGSLRPAMPADITHIRWSFARAIPIGGTGKLNFRGSVK